MNLERLRILKDVADRPNERGSELYYDCCLAARVSGEFGMPVAPGHYPSFGLTTPWLASPARGFSAFFDLSIAEADRLCSGESMTYKRKRINNILAKAEAQAKADKAKRVAANRAATMAALAKLTEPGAKPVRELATGRRKTRAPVRV